VGSGSEIEADISNLQTTKVTAAQATSLAQSAMTSRFGTAGQSGSIEADISTLQTTKVTANQATAIAQSEITAELSKSGGVNARIASLETTKVDAAQASSIAQSEVSAELDGPTGLKATAQQTSEALTTLDGKLKATYQNKLEVYSGNRLVQTGFAMGAAIGEDGTSRSEFLIHADTFGLLTKKNGVTHSPFVFDVANDTVFLKNAFIENGTITNAKISNGTIEAAKIKNGEITSAKIASGAITTAKIDDAAIVSAKIGTAEVGTLKLAGNSVSISVGVTVNSNSTSFSVAPVDGGTLIIVGEINPNFSIPGQTITVSASGVGTLAVLHPNSYTVTEYESGEAGNPYEATYYQSRVQLAVVSIPAGSRTITVTRSHSAITGFISFNLAMR
ncbi:phage tail tip fiber protein, partial [Orrella sp. 11846]|uniref:phage tail tip fiber protein n=1 Tax=Orrella sp. 11846 TaxID=3409913 RepID=UPI003B5C7021